MVTPRRYPSDPPAGGLTHRRELPLEREPPVQQTRTPAAGTQVRLSHKRRYFTAQALAAGAEPLMTRHRTTEKQHLIKPSRIKADWVFDTDTEQWQLTQVSVIGQRMRQGGAGTLPGTERSANWRAKDLHEAPAWVQKFVDAEQPEVTRGENQVTAPTITSCRR